MKNRFKPITTHLHHDAGWPDGLAGAPIAPPVNNVSWKAGVSGDWTNASDWTGGAVPGSSNDVTIGVSGNYTVSITTSDAAHSLTIGSAGTNVADNGGALALTTKLSLNAGTFALSNGGGVSGGTFAIAAGALVTSTANGVIGSVVTDGGNITISDGLLELDGGGSLGGTIGGAGTLGLGGSGIFTTSGLSETATLAIYNNAVLTSSAASGTIAGPVVFYGNGTLAVANHDTLTLSAGITTGAAGGDIGRGNFSGPGTVTTHGVSNLFTNGADVSLYLGGGVTWVNGGTVNDNGIVYLNFTGGDTVSIVNNAGASFNFVSDYAQFQLPNSGTDKFSNAGTLAKTGGTGVSTLQAVLTNTGLINVVSGVLELDSGGALGGTLSGAGTLGFGGGSFTTSGLSGGGTIAVYNNASLTGTTASATVAGAAVLYGNGTLAVANHDTLTISGGLTTGAADSDIGRGNFSGPGTVTTNGISNLYTNGADVSLYLGGGITWVNGGTVNDNGIVYLNFTGGDTVSIVNNAGASFNFVSDYAQFQLPNSGTDKFSNAGTLAKTGGTGVSTLQAVLTNTGLINVVSGVLELDAGGAVGGTLSGAGTLGFGGGSFTTSGLSGGGTIAVYGGASLTGTTASAIIAGPALLSLNGTLAAASHDTLTISGGITTGAAGGDALRGNLSGPGTVVTNGVSNLYTNGGDVTLYLGGGVTWVNGGTVNDSGIVYLNFVTNDTVSIVNNAGASFNLVSDYAQFQLPNSGTDNFTNAGTFAKTGGSGTSSLAMNLSNSGKVAAASGVLLVQGSVSNTGLLLASGGGTLDLSQATLTNLSGTTLSGGAFEADANSFIELVNDAGIVTDSAAVTLSGVGSALRWFSSGTNAQAGLESTLATLTAAGTFSLLNGRNFASTVGNFADGGVLSLGGVTFSVTSLAVKAGGTATGYGRITAAITDAGTISATGGTLVLAGTVSGTGALQASAGATVDLTKGGALTEAVSGAGTLQLDGGTYTLANATLAIASVAVDAGAALSGTGSVTGAVTDAGSIVANGGTLALSGLVSGAGSLVANAGSVLALSGSGTLSEAVSGAGTLQLAGGTWALAGGSVATANVAIAAGATLSGFGTVSGALSDAGTLTASGGVLDLTGGAEFAGTVNGSGTLQLDSGSYTLDGIALATASATIGAGATLTGTGSVTGALADAGSLVASGGTLSVAGAISGSGTVSAAAGAVLDIAGGGSFAGTIGGAGTARIDAALTLQAGATLAATTVIDAANLTLGAGESLTNSAGNLFSITDSAGATVTLAGAAGDKFTNAGSLTVSGAGSTDITVALANSGALSVNSGTLLVHGALTDTGSVALASGSVLGLFGGGSLSGGDSGAGALQLHGATAYSLSGAAAFATSVSLDAGTTLSGSGTLSGAIANNGTLAASGGKLVLSGALSGTGVYQAAAGAVLDLTAGGKLNPAISGAGTLELGGVFTTGTSLPTVANLAIDAGASLTGTGTIASVLADAGRVTASGGTLKLAGAFSGGGTFSAAAGAVLDFAHTGTLTGNVGGAGTVRIDASTKFDTGASLSASNVIDTANVVLGTGVTLANGAGRSFTMTSSAGATISVSGQAGDKLSNGGSLIVGGAGTARIAVGAVNTGTVSVNAGTLTFQSTLANNGTISIGAATVIDNKSLSGTGTTAIGNAATLSLLGGSAATSVVDFAASGGLLNLATPNSFHGHIADFAVGDTIDLLNTAETGFSYSAGVLTVTNNGAAVAKLHFTGSYSQSDFALGTDNHGGTFITHT